jgi:hypothetical protein
MRYFWPGLTAAGLHLEQWENRMAEFTDQHVTRDNAVHLQKCLEKEHSKALCRRNGAAVSL